MVEFAIAGAKFRPNDAKATLLAAQEGDKVSLIPEPTNPYDPNAIQVHIDGQFVGFVPKVQTEDVQPLIDAGYSATVKLQNGYFTEIEVEYSGEGADEPDEDLDSSDDEPDESWT